MKGKMVFGALLVSVALASQGFGFDLLDRAKGLRCGGCGTCNACAAPACAPCAAPKACAAEPCGKATCGPCARRCDLFAGLKDLLACRKCGKVKCGCEAACSPCEKVKACDPCKACEKVKACVPEPACRPCEKVKACEPACAKVKACTPACEKVKACTPACNACDKVAGCGQACKTRCRKPLIHKDECGCNCRPKLGHGLVVDILDDLFACKRCEKKSCGGGCGDGGCGCGGTITVAPSKSADAAPITPAEEVGPLPIPPKGDPSASLIRPRSIYQASRTIVQN